MSTEAAALTADQSHVLQVVFDAHCATRTWPTFGDLDRRLARSRQIHNLAQVVRGIPVAMLQPLWSGNVSPDDGAQVRLTAQGMAECGGSEDDLELFVRTLRWVAKRQLTFEPKPPDGDTECTVTGQQLMRAFRLPVSRRPDVERLGHLLHVEHCGWLSASANDWNWRFAVSREVRRFANVRSIEDYLAARRAWSEESLPLVANPAGFIEDAQPSEPFRAYVDEAIIEVLERAVTLRGLSGDKFVAVLRELNDNYTRRNPYACHALLRAILDHLPPLLGCKNFDQVVSNVAWGQTDRKYMKKLLDFKLQADDALHRQISSSNYHLTIDDLPPAVWLRRLLAAIPQQP